jgi:hypothetical protein
MHQKLAGLTYRPDAVLLFSGHNEFESRFTWRRNIRYYVDEQLPTPVTTMLECALQWSPFCRLILETQERQRLDATPEPAIKRQLVDQPVCSRQERADIVADFEGRLESIAAYCEAIMARTCATAT